MSKQVTIIIGVAVVLAIIAGVAIWYFFFRKDEEKAKSESGSTSGSSSYIKGSDKFIAAAKEAFGFDEDKVKMLVAGLNVFKQLKEDELVKMVEGSDEEKKKKAKDIVGLQPKVEEFIKKETKDDLLKMEKEKAIEFVLGVVKGDHTISSENIKKKTEEPFKGVISRILEALKEVKDTLEKKIDAYEKSTLLEAIVCGVPTISV